MERGVIRLAIIGCGAVVEGSHARVLPSLGNQFRVTVCLDVDMGRARAVAAQLGAGRAAHVTELSDHLSSFDAALIATPPAYHADLVRRVLEGGRHVLVEKPFVTSSREALALIDLASSKGKRLLVGHFRRFYPSVQAARHALASGQLARPSAIEVWEGGRWDWPARSDYAFTSPDGGVALDTGSHALDTALFVLGVDEDDVRLRPLHVEKQPSSEPSQAVSVRGTLETGGREIDIVLRLSRLEPLATAVRVHCGDDAIVVGAAHAATATRIQRRVPTPLEPPPAARYLPPDALSAIYCEYLELAQAMGDPAYDSVLDATRFVALTRILEEITHAGVAA